MNGTEVATVTDKRTPHIWRVMATPTVSSETLTHLLEDFLIDHPSAVLLEDGNAVFDFSTARYAVSGDEKCVLHVWSEERNIVRRVVDAQLRGAVLCLNALRFGQSHPHTLEICAVRNRATAASQRAARVQYEHLLQRVLQREYPGSKLEMISSKADLEHSFSPVYTRAVLRNGQSAFAVLGVNHAEPQASVDAALTFGILWLDYQRQHLAGRFHVEGLMVFLPQGGSEIVSQRMAHLNQTAAKWHIYELDEHSELCEEVDFRDHGNLATRLERAVDQSFARERFGASIARIQALVPQAHVTVESPTEILFRLYGLEFARARIAPVSGSFRNQENIVFGIGGAEYSLDDSTERLFVELIERLSASRHPAGSHKDPIYRLCPERWLESLITCAVGSVDERLDPRYVYSQVPAFTASDRAMLDVLTCTLDGRLAILELKAADDIHLPLQGLDYWARVRWHQHNGGFTRNGYFAGRELSPAPPLLYLVAPVLRTHPATDTLLRYLCPEIEWSLVQLDEHWRAGIRVVNRKRSPRAVQG